MSRPVVVLSINAAWNVINFRVGLVRGLQAAGYRVVALTPRDPFADAFADLDVEHIELPMDTRGMSPTADLRLLWRYWRTLQRLRPAAYLGYTIKPNVWGSLAARWAGVPVINNIAGLGETFLGKGALNRLVRRLYRLALASSATVFFQNPDDRDLFVGAGIVREAQTRLLPGSGVDIKRFAPVATGTGKEGAAISFLLVARLLHAKGIADFVEAGRIVRARVRDARLRVLGIAQEGKGAIAASQLAEWVANGDLELLPAVKDVRPVLAAADCVVLPTYYPEGTPRSLLEAAAMSLPIIATDVPGCREIVRDGENGFLVPPRAPARLAERMLEIAGMSRQERARLGAASRALVEQTFDEQIVVARYLEALAALSIRRP